MGDTKVGPFDIDEKIAREMLVATNNPNNRSNSDVIKPWVNGLDITRRPRNMWIIDFGTYMSEEESSQYKMPFEYILEHVKPFRETGEIGRSNGGCMVETPTTSSRYAHST